MKLAILCLLFTCLTCFSIEPTEDINTGEEAAKRAYRKQLVDKLLRELQDQVSDIEKSLWKLEDTIVPPWEREPLKSQQ